MFWVTKRMACNEYFYERAILKNPLLLQNTYDFFTMQYRIHTTENYVITLVALFPFNE